MGWGRVEGGLGDGYLEGKGRWRRGGWGGGWRGLGGGGGWCRTCWLRFGMNLLGCGKEISINERCDVGMKIERLGREL